MHTLKRSLFLLSFGLAVAALPVAHTEAQPPSGAVVALSYHQTFATSCGEGAFTIDGGRRQVASGTTFRICGVNARICEYRTQWFGVPAGAHQVCSLTGGIIQCGPVNVPPGDLASIILGSRDCF